ncbi:hypothetical protein LEP1GSC041_3789 [Leptospira noguchii str. 2006001870]|uniref:Uncharacterized protein n=1 Tax=Leptospira noguchii serovar Autumnalis str. ZUN142 TaxID=1085540 RepID=M6UXT4_9LEPT|nr:hypothetical protein LEP1GSC041_3789 [Leptospira noguchii str. 2006001870]EMO42108.1 hypothetical protein LEP1GSC186_2296 [Leptospira noguchii serovar Autumnalis str. ZUN142]
MAPELHTETIIKKNTKNYKLYNTTVSAGTLTFGKRIRFKNNEFVGTPSKKQFRVRSNF